MHTYWARHISYYHSIEIDSVIFTLVFDHEFDDFGLYSGGNARYRRGLSSSLGYFTWVKMFKLCINIQWNGYNNTVRFAVFVDDDGDNDDDDGSSYRYYIYSGSLKWLQNAIMVLSGCESVLYDSSIKCIKSESESESDDLLNFSSQCFCIPSPAAALFSIRLLLLYQFLPQLGHMVAFFLFLLYISGSFYSSFVFYLYTRLDFYELSFTVRMSVCVSFFSSIQHLHW